MTAYQLPIDGFCKVEKKLKEAVFAKRMHQSGRFSATRSLHSNNFPQAKNKAFAFLKADGYYGADQMFTTKVATIGYVLALYWLCIDCVLAVYWLCIDCVLTVY